MKLFTSFTAIIAAASAGQIFSQPQAQHYARAADAYQTAVEHQKPGVYAGQAHSFPAQESQHQVSAYERPSAEKTAKILAYYSENDGHNYNYGYETDNGISAQEVGHVSRGTRAEGAYSYKGDDGQTYTVTYSADEQGFRAQGAHLPTPPPIPHAILKALEENAKAEANGIYDDGHYHEDDQVDHHPQQTQQAEQGYQYEGYSQLQDYAPAQASSEAGHHH